MFFNKLFNGFCFIYLFLNLIGLVYSRFFCFSIFAFLLLLFLVSLLFLLFFILSFFLFFFLFDWNFNFNFFFNVLDFLSDAGCIDSDIDIDIFNVCNVDRAHHKLNDQIGCSSYILILVLLFPIINTFSRELFYNFIPNIDSNLYVFIIMVER